MFERIKAKLPDTPEREMKTLTAEVAVEVSKPDEDGNRTVTMDVDGLGGEVEHPEEIVMGPDDGFEFQYTGGVEIPEHLDVVRKDVED